MAVLDTRRAELAARLAQAVGSRGVVCVGCAARLMPGASGLITLSRPPLHEPYVELERLLLLIADADPPTELLTRAAVTVPEVWLLGEVLTVLRAPRLSRYRRRELILPGESVRLVALPELEFVPVPAR